jgi:hypothetical protein
VCCVGAVCWILHCTRTRTQMLTQAVTFAQDRMDDVHVHPMSSSSSQRMFLVDINKGRSIYIRRGHPQACSYSSGLWEGQKGPATADELSLKVETRAIIGFLCKRAPRPLLSLSDMSLSTWRR